MEAEVREEKMLHHLTLEMERRGRDEGNELRNPEGQKIKDNVSQL